MNKKLLNVFFTTVIIGQLFAASFLVEWNGESIGNRLDNVIGKLIL